MSKSKQAIFAAGIIGVASLAAAFAIAHPGEESHGNISISHSNNGDGVGNFWSKSDDLDLRANWRGEFSFNDAGTAFSSLDGRIEIEEKKDGEKIRAVFSGEGGAIETSFSVNGRKREIKDADHKRMAALINLFVLESGVNADERVAKLYARGGANTVFAEVDKMRNDHGAKKYLEALAETAPLSEVEIDAYALRAKKLDGDHAKRKAIGAVFVHQQGLTPEGREIMLKAAQGVRGDHEIRKLMEAAAMGEMTPGAVETAMTLMGRISGDHEIRKGAEALLDNDAFTDEMTVKLLGMASSHIDGDHERRKMVDAVEGRIARSDQVAAAAIRVVDEISSDHDRRNSVETIAESLNEKSENWARLIEAADKIGSDREKSNALETLSDTAPRDPVLRAQLRAAAERISSSRERQRAIEALE